MATKPPPSGRVLSSDLRGQAKVIYEVRRLVNEWRGFELGTASEAYPNAPPRYEPGKDSESPLTETSRSLLLHWFRREPHLVGGTNPFKYWPHQRQLVETFIYLYEVRGVRRTEQLYELAGVESSGAATRPLDQARWSTSYGLRQDQDDVPHHRMGVLERCPGADLRTRHRSPLHPNCPWSLRSRPAPPGLLSDGRQAFRVPLRPSSPPGV